MPSRFPLLYQVNTRIFLGELSRAVGRPATLDSWPEADLDRAAARGFDWFWPLGVWQTGAAGRAAARVALDWDVIRRDLPDLADADVVSSPFAITGYTTNADFGGAAALARLRSRLRKRGLRLMLDFVPNHTALDHSWVHSNPEFYVQGSEANLDRAPQNYCRLDGRIFAHGRDPYFDGWRDTLQLNYRHPGLRAAQIATLIDIAGQCDGIRCDMAMLLLPDVIARTWGLGPLPDGKNPINDPFWPEAIAAVRAVHPDFTFMAEVYWDLEWTLQQQGFDYTYDKRLYDRLLERHAEGVRGHLWADPDFQRRSVRFLENHDEPRAAAALDGAAYRAAAVAAFFVPGLRFFHEGQLEGRRFRVPMQLGRRPDEIPDTVLLNFHERLLACLSRSEVRDGCWQLLDDRPAWDGNASNRQFLAYLWKADGRTLLVCVNFGPSPAQCYVSLLPTGLAGRTWRLKDLMTDASYDRAGSELESRGLYLDVPAWGYHVFEVSAV